MASLVAIVVLTAVGCTTLTRIQPSGPYGGCKESGHGRLGGLEGLREFTRVKNTRLTVG